MTETRFHRDRVVWPVSARTRRPEPRNPRVLVEGGSSSARVHSATPESQESALNIAACLRRLSKGPG